METTAAAPLNNNNESSNDNKKDHHDEEAAKFSVRQRVYARDAETGLLYKAVVRRIIYGTPPLKQLRVGIDISTEDEIEQFQQTPEPPGWHYFVHYMGWNVKWDRWIPESSLFEPSEKTAQHADRLAKELALAKKQKGTNVMVALKRRMEQLEKERRVEERREELARQGKVCCEGKVEEEKPAKRQKWNKNSIEKEFKLRQDDLEANIYQRPVLPFSLKKILVEEWEIVTQCGMVPNLPSKVTVRQALEKYRASKLELLQEEEEDTSVKEAAEEIKDDGENKDVGEENKDGDENNDTENGADENQESIVENKKKEWTEMVEGICLFFDQALPFRLLYRQELGQLHFIESSEELGEMRKSDVYGCEHLLRLFCHLPSLMAQELDDTRPIMGKVADLTRFLHKHQSTLFTQSYKRPNPEEQQMAQRLGRKRKAFSSSNKRAGFKTDPNERETSAVSAADS